MNNTLDKSDFLVLKNEKNREDKSSPDAGWFEGLLRSMSIPGLSIADAQGLSFEKRVK